MQLLRIVISQHLQNQKQSRDCAVFQIIHQQLFIHNYLVKGWYVLSCKKYKVFLVIKYLKVFRSRLLAEYVWQSLVAECFGSFVVENLKKNTTPYSAKGTNFVLSSITHVQSFYQAYYPKGCVVRRYNFSRMRFQISNFWASAEICALMVSYCFVISHLVSSLPTSLRSEYFRADISENVSCLVINIGIVVTAPNEDAEVHCDAWQLLVCFLVGYRKKLLTELNQFF